MKTLLNEEKSAGNHSVQFNASHLASGIYLYRIQAENFVQTKKMILLK
ncbi:MAG: T9SS type A sorting domain-containing protein [Ignavibacteriaceae bacterium]|nr:T9SS type A sorting domain-containing protein [Ignavibacteriaceae bacterium]